MKWPWRHGREARRDVAEAAQTAQDAAESKREAETRRERILERAAEDDAYARRLRKLNASNGFRAMFEHALRGGHDSSAG
jgi:hypothetical protein